MNTWNFHAGGAISGPTPHLAVPRRFPVPAGAVQDGPMTEASLARFETAQDAKLGGYAAALAELRTTGKRSHWIWWIFPQLRGLGSSSTSLAFALSVSEASEYLKDSTLGPRLLEASELVARRLDEGISLDDLMGSEIDALKLVSSLTLFEQLAARDTSLESARLAAACSKILNRVMAQGYERCAFTLAALKAG